MISNVIIVTEYLHIFTCTLIVPNLMHQMSTHNVEIEKKNNYPDIHLNCPFIIF